MTAKEFFEKFDQLAEAPDAVAKMRELILEWAVTGKLCHDTTVMWREATLRDVIELISGQHLLADEQNYEGRGIPYLTGPADFGDKHPTATRWTDRPKVVAEPGDILITVKGSGCGKTNVLTGQPTAISRQLMAIRVTGADPDFVHVVVKRAAEHFQRAKTGIAIPGIDRKEVLSLDLVLPPLPQQKRIVAKVDELMALCDRLEAQQRERESRQAELTRASLARFADAPTPANLNFLFHASYDIGPAELRKTILTLAVQGKLVAQDIGDEPATDLLKRIKSKKIELGAEGARSIDAPIAVEAAPFELPRGWVWRQWQSVALKIGDIDHMMPESVDVGVPYVSPRDFLPGNRIDFDGAKKISPEDYARLAAKIKPEKGDLIYPRYGTIGENRLVTDSREFLASYSCAVIKTMNGFIEPRYQYLFSVSDLCRSQAKAAENKTTQANVGIKSIKSFLMPIPPLAEQRRIVANVDELMALVEQLEAQLSVSHKVGADLLGAVVAELVA